MIAYLDIETRKVPVVPPYQNPARPTSRPITRRWQTFMVGLGLEGGEVTILENKNESQLMIDLANWLLRNRISTIVYSATRQFDEMILRGRFINARRELLDSPGPWPALHIPDRFTWLCLPAEPNSDPEGSRNAPVWYDSGNPTAQQRVRSHCRADVLRLINRKEEIAR